MGTKRRAKGGHTKAKKIKLEDDTRAKGDTELAELEDFEDNHEDTQESDDDLEGDEFLEGSKQTLGFPTNVEIKPKLESTDKEKSKKIHYGSFQTMRLSDNIFKALKKKGYKNPTPIQRKTIPLIMAGQDVVAMARTGSGKTAAFLIPLFEKLKQHKVQFGARAVILVPTRELAIQCAKFIHQIGKFTDLRTCVLVGGDSIEEQFTQLAANPDILVATPGRLMHHLSDADISLQAVEYLVFDEADRLFEMGFSEQINEILKKIPEQRQTVLFSATLPQLLVDFARAGLNNPQLIRLDTDTKMSDTLKLAFFTCTVEEKAAALFTVLKTLIKPQELTVIFAATRHHVEYLHQLLTLAGLSSTFIYGTMDPTARKINLANFRNGKHRILLVTDLAARGIDIPLLDNVINYDFPPKSKLFVHRVGRVARMGRLGTAYSLVSLDELPYMVDWHLFANKELKNEATEGDADTGIFYGKIPQYLLDIEQEGINHLLELHSDLSSQKKVTKNAYKLYYQTRAKPSSEAVKMSKELPNPPKIHPVLLSKTKEDELKRADILASIKNFRPPETIFEAFMDATKEQANLVMSEKRKFHEEKIKERKKEKGNKDNSEQETKRKLEEISKEEEQLEEEESAKKKKTFKDPNFYLDPIPKNNYSELGLAVNDSNGLGSANISLDIHGEDEDTMYQEKSVKKWDRKRKKFVNVKAGEDVNRKKKNESGVKVREEKGKLYADWQKRTHMRIPRVGEDEDAQAVAWAKQQPFKKFKYYTKPQISSVNSGLKDPDQIRKERKLKMKRQMKMMNKGKRSTMPQDKAKFPGAPTRSKKIIKGNFNKKRR